MSYVFLDVLSLLHLLGLQRGAAGAQPISGQLVPSIALGRKALGVHCKAPSNQISKFCCTNMPGCRHLRSYCSSMFALKGYSTSDPIYFTQLSPFVDSPLGVIFLSFVLSHAESAPEP